MANEKTWYQKNAWWIWSLIIIGVVLVISAIAVAVVAIIIALMGGFGGDNDNGNDTSSYGDIIITSSDIIDESSSSGITELPAVASSLPEPPIYLPAFPCPGAEQTTFYIAIDENDDYSIVTNPSLAQPGAISFNLCNDPDLQRLPLYYYFKENAGEKRILFGTDETPPTGFIAAANPLGYIFAISSGDIGVTFDEFYKLTGNWVHSESFQNIEFDLLTNDNTDPQTYGIQTFNGAQLLGYTNP